MRKTIGCLAEPEVPFSVFLGTCGLQGKSSAASKLQSSTVNAKQCSVCVYHKRPLNLHLSLNTNSLHGSKRAKDGLCPQVSYTLLYFGSHIPMTGFIHRHENVYRSELYSVCLGKNIG